MNNTLLDNSDNLKLVDTLKEILSDSTFNHLQIATGYWDIPGTKLLYDELLSFFQRGGRLELLIGKEPQLRSYQLRDDLTNDEKKFPDFYIKRDIDKLNDTYKPVVQMLLDYADENNESDSQIKIHVYGQGDIEKFLHAKCYIAYAEDPDGEPQKAYGIIGSSNFTEKGLQDNAELNYLETNKIIVGAHSAVGNSKSHKVWFNEMWENSEPWTGKFIKEILKPSPIGTKIIDENLVELPQELTPYEIYIKYLQLQFGDLVDSNVSEILKSYLPPHFNQLEYQLDAVKQCFSIMKRFGGVLLGDVVGLGKTVVGVLLIRHFLENAEVLGRPAKVLIVTPPAIKSAWKETIEEFDKNTKNNIGNYVEFVTTGSIGKLNDFEDGDGEEDGEDIEDMKFESYGLILIDESHNFRNSDTQKYQAINDLIGRISPTPYVVLLSATPQNNSPKDIYNQIRLFQRNPNNSNLPNVEGGKLDSFFRKMETEFMEARNLPQDTPEGKEEAKKIIKEISDQVRKCVLNDLLVRRTRSDIKKMYGEDAEQLKFPTIQGPHKLEYKMSPKLQQLFFDTTEAICYLHEEPFDPEKHIGFFRYAAITQFKNSEHAKLYEKRNLTVESITRRLKRIMQILLVKRLESSMAAFKKTLENLRRYNDVMIEMIKHDCVYICPDLDVNKLHQEAGGNFEKFRAKVEELIEKKGGNNRRFKASDFKDNYLDDLLGDKTLIDNLLDRWRENAFDPKARRFDKALINDLFDPAINNPSGKNKPRLVIFTEAVDTLDSLVENIEAEGHSVLKISSKNRGENQSAIKANFDANVKPEDQRDEYDVIITTEVLAEGVNLHRSNVILNYDAPWNATRLMQRIGRVNRIGSSEEFVHVFNFFPSDEGNSQIRLIEKAYAKLQSFHEMFGEDNKVFSEREELSEHDLQKFVDGELSPFAPFITELKEYRTAHPERYAYIASLDADNIGGSVTVAETENSLFIFTDNSHSYISVEVPADYKEKKPKVISSLSTLERLKCDPTARFISAELGDNALYKVAKRTYEKHVAHANTAADRDSKTRKALEVLTKLRNENDFSRETRKLLSTLEGYVRDNDMFLTKQILNFENQEPSLFGVDYELEYILKTSFSNYTDKAREKRGEAKLAIYEIKV